MSILQQNLTIAIIVVLITSCMTPNYRVASTKAAHLAWNQDQLPPGKTQLTDSDATAILDRLPLTFVETVNEAGRVCGFSARAAGCDFSISPSQATITLMRPAKHESSNVGSFTNPLTSDGTKHRDSVQVKGNTLVSRLRLQLSGANPQARISGDDRLPGKANYFIGDQKHWHTGISTYSRVRVEEVYRGIDIVYYCKGKQLEFDFNLAPGANYKTIRLRPENADRISIDSSGDALINFGSVTLRQHRPVAYQIVDGQRREIVAHYTIRGREEIGFQIGAYDSSVPLTIDPLLSYSSFFGGSGNDYIYAVGIDSQGNAVVAGSTDSQDLSITPGAFQPVSGIAAVATTGFVAKIDLSTNTLLFSTYFGGRITPFGTFSSTDCLALTTDTSGNVYVTGRTSAVDFPITPNAFQRMFAGGTDAFVAKLNNTGTTLLYSTFLGSSKSTVGFSPIDEGLGIAVDTLGNAYVTGLTIGADFPVTAGAFKTTHDQDSEFVGEIDPARVGYTDAFLTKLNQSGSALIYSSYLGGLGNESGNGIKVDSQGRAYVVGTTRAADFPISNAIQPTLAGGSDAFITVFNADGSSLSFSTYVGGTSDDSGKAIAIAESGSIYFTGNTASTDLPVTARAVQSTNADVSIYKSTNGGANWSPSNTGMPGISDISQISIDPANHSNVFAGTHGRVFNSSDGGLRWKSSVGAPSLLVVTFDPKKPTTVYGVSAPGFFLPRLLKSSNGGQSWEGLDKLFPTNLPVRNIFNLTVDPSDASTIYASTDLGLFKAENDGNWVERSKGLPNRGAGVAILAIDPRNSERLFALDSSELFVTNNGGKRWDLNSLTGTTIFSIAFDPLLSSTIYAAGAGLFKSTDNGESWQEVDNDLPTIGFDKLIIDPHNSSVFYMTTRGGVFKTTDAGHHWTSINNGLGKHFLGLNGALVSLSIDPVNSSILFAHTPVASSDAFVGKINPSHSGIDYLTYLGGTGADSVVGLGIDREGNAYISGDSGSVDFPTIRAFQPDQFFQSVDLFVARLGPDGTDISFSTYLGGTSLDHSNGIAVDGSGNVYVVGYTLSADWPLNTPLQSLFRRTEGFLARVSNMTSSQPPPAISEILPARGSSAGQYAVIVTGSNFLPGARLRIGGVPVTISEITSTRITGVVNGRASGITEEVDVVVSNVDGQSTVKKDAFTFLQQPVIGAVTLMRKELAVLGDGLDKGGVILLDGRPQNTRVELSGSVNNPFLLSKKAAKRIAPGQTVIVQVTSASGLTSAPFSYTRPLN